MTISDKSQPRRGNKQSSRTVRTTSPGSTPARPASPGVPPASRGRGKSVPSGEREESWRARTEALLRHELAFIPNRRFAQLPAAEAKQLEQLDLAPYEGSGLRHDMPAHLARLCEAPLLTEDLEKQLFRRLNYLKFQANQLRAQLDPAQPNPTAVLRAEFLLREAKRTLDLIVSANSRLVVSLVKRLKSSDVTFDELLSDGLVGVIRAAEKFDESRGYRFSTYATMVVRRELYRTVQGAHRERGRFALTDQQWLHEQAVEEIDSPLPEHQWLKMFHTLDEMLNDLDPRERQIMHARFGFVEIGRKPSLQALADLLGVCKERVRQLERRALAKLQEMAKHRDLKQFSEAYEP